MSQKNKESTSKLMQDQNFIRCSVLIAELLLKYKTKEIEVAEASGESKGSLEPDATYGDGVSLSAVDGGCLKP